MRTADICGRHRSKGGKDVGGRYGDVIVDGNGKWQWKTGWRSGPQTQYKFVVTVTQVSPGDNEDKSASVTKSFDS